MLYNLTDILTNEEKEIALSVSFEPDTVSNGYESCPIREKSDVRLQFKNCAKGEVQIEGACELVLETSCARCLKSVSYPMELHISEYIRERDLADAESMEEHPFLDGYVLDVDALIRNEIMLNWPMKVLCRPECKGICTVCGKDLNEGDCGCDTFVPDPRMAAIKDIFDGINKEV